MTPLAANLIRTYTPAAVGVVASWAATRGIHVGTQTQAAAVITMTGVFTGAYYTVVRVLEERYPAVGRVLLLAPPAHQLAAAAEPPYDPQEYDHAGWISSLHDDGPAEPPAPYQPPAATTMVVAAAAPPSASEPPAATGPTLSQIVAETRPDPVKVRKADTGAIPTYKTPPGR